MPNSPTPPHGSEPSQNSSSHGRYQEEEIHYSSTYVGDSAYQIGEDGDNENSGKTRLPEQNQNPVDLIEHYCTNFLNERSKKKYYGVPIMLDLIAILVVDFLRVIPDEDITPSAQDRKYCLDKFSEFLETQTYLTKPIEQPQTRKHLSSAFHKPAHDDLKRDFSTALVTAFNQQYYLAVPGLSDQQESKLPKINKWIKIYVAKCVEEQPAIISENLQNPILVQKYLRFFVNTSFPIMIATTPGLADKQPLLEIRVKSPNYNSKRSGSTPKSHIHASEQPSATFQRNERPSSPQWPTVIQDLTIIPIGNERIAAIRQTVEDKYEALTDLQKNHIDSLVEAYKNSGISIFWKKRDIFDEALENFPETVVATPMRYNDLIEVAVKQCAIKYVLSRRAENSFLITAKEQQYFLENFLPTSLTHGLIPEITNLFLGSSTVKIAGAAKTLNAALKPIVQNPALEKKYKSHPLLGLNLQSSASAVNPHNHRQQQQGSQRKDSSSLSFFAPKIFIRPFSEDNKNQQWQRVGHNSSQRDSHVIGFESALHETFEGADLVNTDIFELSLLRHLGLTFTPQKSAYYPPASSNPRIFKVYLSGNEQMQTSFLEAFSNKYPEIMILMEGTTQVQDSSGKRLSLTCYEIDSHLFTSNVMPHLGKEAIKLLPTVQQTLLVTQKTPVKLPSSESRGTENQSPDFAGMTEAEQLEYALALSLQDNKSQPDTNGSNSMGSCQPGSSFRPG